MFSRRKLHGRGVRLQMQRDQQIVKSLTQRTGHVLGTDGVQQLLLVDVRAQYVSSPIVGLVAHGGVQGQRVSVETGKSV